MYPVWVAGSVALAASLAQQCRQGHTAPPVRSSQGEDAPEAYLEGALKDTDPKEPTILSERKRHINYFHINFLCRPSPPGLSLGQTGFVPGTNPVKSGFHCVE